MVAKIQDTDNTKSWQGCGTARTLIHCWCKIVWLFRESLVVSYNTKNTPTLRFSNHAPDGFL